MPKHKHRGGDRGAYGGGGGTSIAALLRNARHEQSHLSTLQEYQVTLLTVRVRVRVRVREG